MYDLLIKNGRVIDPAQNIDDRLDVAISGGKIATVARDIPPGEGKQVVDATDKIVTPGLIDLHCHVYDSISPIGVEPDAAGVRQGVTTVVDAGSAGQATFAGFPRYVIPSYRTNIFCFLHLSSTGLSIMPEPRDWEEIDLDATIATIESNRDIIKGIKLRLVGKLIASAGVEVVAMAKKAARKVGLPVMIHIGDLEKRVSPTLTREMLPLLEEGDILSHVFTARYGSAMQANGKMLPELRQAAERGVVLDVARGINNLSFEIARKAMAQGIMPSTLSSDVILASLTGPTFGLTVIMSKFMALGLSLNQVVEMTTINSARAISADDKIGSLKPGMNGDVSILELRPGTWRLEDAEGETIETHTLISPSTTIISGQVIPANPVAQPQPVG
ncbi:MAG: amidohydrolase/deacetylase family metallohydrolase [Chloroflexota bacterium]|nr:amidohydrolase/deacetylase family metallohydrolase [Chloroflexota bacterium]